MQRAEDGGLRANKSAGGFTLIETVITLVVLSIAAVGVLSVFTTGIKGSANPLLVDQATHLAQGEMEQVLGEKLANGFTGVGSSCITTMLPGFTCGRTICYVSPTLPNGLNDTSACGTVTNYKHITVTISQAVIGSVSVETVVTNY
jgi:prepilin-type N-terminal cleavage/methylation domain-containing protein